MSRARTKTAAQAADVSTLDDKALLALYGAPQFRQPWDRYADLVRAGESARAAEFKTAFARARAAWAEHEKRVGPSAGMPPWFRDGRVPGRTRVVRRPPPEWGRRLA